MEEACELYRRHEALVRAGYRGGYGVPPPDEIGEGPVAYVPDEKLTVNAGHALPSPFKSVSQLIHRSIWPDPDSHN